MRSQTLQPFFLCMALEHLGSSGEASSALLQKQATR